MIAGATALGLTWGAALAQTPSPGFPQTRPDPTPPTTSPTQIDKDASAVLPSAGSSGPSAAPTMVRDCVKNPSDCTKPPNAGDQATGQGAQSTKPQ
jgi:hypothetical protein